MHNDLPLERRDIIASRLEQGQGAVAATLALEFGVSEDAIRRDLRALAAEGKCRRVYGGALPLSPAHKPLAERIDEGQEDKAALARAAATLVQNNTLVFLDNGSSNLALIRFLPRDAGLTIATNSAHIAVEVQKRADLQLFLIGGTVDTAVGGCVDASAVQQVQLLHIDYCFLGACAVAASGIAAFHAADALFKRSLLAASTHVAVMATTEKLHTRAPHRVCSLDDIDQLIVAHDAPVAALAAAGAALLTAPPP